MSFSKHGKPPEHLMEGFQQFSMLGCHESTQISSLIFEINIQMVPLAFFIFPFKQPSGSTSRLVVSVMNSAMSKHRQCVFKVSDSCQLLWVGIGTV